MGTKRGAWNDWKHYTDTARNQQGGAGQASNWVNAFIGGPAGWYKAAAHEQGLGGTYGEHHASDYLAGQKDGEALFNAMTDEEHNAFENMDQGKQQAFLDDLRERIKTGNIEGDKQALADKKLADEKTARDTQQKNIIDRVTAFAQEMNMPIGELMQKDEFAQALNKQSFQNAMGAGGGAGMGGLSQINADEATKRALLGYQGQRQAAGQAAYGNAFNMVNNMGLQAEDLSRYNQSMDLQFQQAEAARQMQQYQQGLGQRQGMGGMIGMGIGAFVGGPSGAAMGQQLGSQFAGQRYQQQNPFQSYKFKYPTSTRGTSAGIGGVKYGGNY